MTGFVLFLIVDWSSDLVKILLVVVPKLNKLMNKSKSDVRISRIFPQGCFRKYSSIIEVTTEMNRKQLTEK